MAGIKNEENKRESVVDGQAWTELRKIEFCCCHRLEIGENFFSLIQKSQVFFTIAIQSPILFSNDSVE